MTKSNVALLIVIAALVAALCVSFQQASAPAPQASAPKPQQQVMKMPDSGVFRIDAGYKGADARSLTITAETKNK